MVNRCCDKALIRPGAKFCNQCGTRLHRTLAEKEELFFKVSGFFDEYNTDLAEDFVEDYDKYGSQALDWYGLVRR